MAAKKDVVPDITRAGGDTVGLRCPNHPLTLRLLNECGLPLAGPSANPSGMPSPKTAQTVLDYFGNGIGAVLDGGDCAIGKESTIIDISQTPYQILREGALSGDEVASALVRGMDVIGITGGTGAGKSTALDILQSMGALVLDCDGIYHRLTEESPKLRAELEARFGGVYKNGKLDRKRLGGLVFGDPKALLELNAITHAHVYREVERLLKEHAMNGGTLAAVDAVALIESGLSSLCTAVFAVTAERETRIGRIMAREGIPREYAERRVDAQKNDEFFVKNCGMILENNGTKEEFAALSRAAFTEVIKNGGKEAGRSDKG